MQYDGDRPDECRGRNFHAEEDLEVLSTDWRSPTVLRVEYECEKCGQAMVASVDLEHAHADFESPPENYWQRREADGAPLPSTIDEDELFTDGGVTAADCPNCYTDDDAETDCPHLLEGDDCPNCGHALEKPRAGKVECPRCRWVVNGQHNESELRSYPMNARQGLRLVRALGQDTGRSAHNVENELNRFCLKHDLNRDEFADVLRDIAGELDGGEE